MRSQDPPKCCYHLGEEGWLGWPTGTKVNHLQWPPSDSDEERQHVKSACGRSFDWTPALKTDPHFPSWKSLKGLREMVGAWGLEPQTSTVSRWTWQA